MSEETNNEQEHPTTEEGKKIVGVPEDVSRFSVGDLVQVHLEMKDIVFRTYPHEERGVVIDLHHEDDEYYYHMPVIQFEKELRMFNPDHVIVVQRADGSPGEVDRLEAAQEATERQRIKDEEENKEKEEDDS